MAEQPESGITVDDLKMFVHMFADDMTILAESKKGSQSGLDALDECCSFWGLIVNIDKTKIVVCL